MLGSKRVSRLQKREKAVATAKATEKVKAVAYLRVSTEEQAQHGLGLESQEREVRAFAVSQGYELVGVFADRGISGATPPTSRPEFAKLVELAEQRAFSVLLVKRFDRLARHIVYAVTTVQQMDERFGVSLQSTSEPIETRTAMGRMIFAIFAGMAEAEREVITDRLHGGRKEKAIRGSVSCGKPPYGYAADKSAKGGLVVVEAEAEVVQRVFAMRAEGQRLQQIADTLNRERVKTRNGKPWRPGTIAYLVDNPKYRGVLEFLFRRGADQHVLRKGKHKAIISA